MGSQAVEALELLVALALVFTINAGQVTDSPEKKGLCHGPKTSIYWHYNLLDDSCRTNGRLRPRSETPRNP